MGGRPYRFSRRGFVQGAAAAAGAATVSGALAQAATQPEPAVFSEVFPIGSEVRRWRVREVHPLHLGAIPLILQRETRWVQVDILAFSGEGLANTEHFSLFLSNRGDGATPTAEPAGLMVMELAERLRAVEATLRAPALLTLEQRRAAHPMGTFRIEPREKKLSTPAA